MKNSNLQNSHAEEAFLDQVFHALSDPTRRALIKRLSEAPEKVTTLAEPFEMSLNAISKHLKTLEKAQLIERDTSGRTSICSLRAEPLVSAQSWLDHYTRYWTGNLDAFAQHMKAKAESENGDDQQ